LEENCGTGRVSDVWAFKTAEFIKIKMTKLILNLEAFLIIIFLFNCPFGAA
jgi:hypothetical protein